MEYFLSDQSTGISKLLVKYKLLKYCSLSHVFAYWLLRMRNNIFNVVLEFGDVKETTTEGDNTSSVADKGFLLRSPKLRVGLAVTLCKLKRRSEHVSGFLLLLHFSCCFPINYLLLLIIT